MGFLRRSGHFRDFRRPGTVGWRSAVLAARLARGDSIGDVAVTVGPEFLHEAIRDQRPYLIRLQSLDPSADSVSRAEQRAERLRARDHGRAARTFVAFDVGCSRG